MILPRGKGEKRNKGRKKGNLGLLHACKDVFGAMIKGKMGSLRIGSLVPSERRLLETNIFFPCTLDCNRGFLLICPSYPPVLSFLRVPVFFSISPFHFSNLFTHNRKHYLLNRPYRIDTGYSRSGSWIFIIQYQYITSSLY